MSGNDRFKPMKESMQISVHRWRTAAQIYESRRPIGVPFWHELPESTQDKWARAVERAWNHE